MSGDIIDKGNERAQEILDEILARARSGPKGEDGIGICLNCGEVLDDARRWCDADCRDDWERQQLRAKKINDET